jgi:hypothetical protein
VIWKGDTLIPGVAETLDLLRSKVRVRIARRVVEGPPGRGAPGVPKLLHAPTTPAPYTWRHLAAAMHLAEALIAFSLSLFPPVATQGKRLVFVTNNSTKSRAGYTAKFKSLGLNVTAVRERCTRRPVGAPPPRPSD